MRTKNFILITCLGALLFIPFLGSVHLFDWDEINFAESAREMLLTHKYSFLQINFQPFTEKPPLFMWVQALSMSIFGVNEFAARLPNAIVGLITLLVIFNVGTRLKDEKFGWIWVLCYIGSFLPHFYFKTGLIDPLFNLFIFLGIYQFVLLTQPQDNKPDQGIKKAVLAGIFIGLAILTKGPVALLVVMFCLFFYWASVSFRSVLPFRYFLFFLLSAFVVSTAWFGMDTLRHGPGFLIGFIQRQLALFSTPDAGHGGPFYYHFVVLFFGCFPASVFMFSALRNESSEAWPERNMKKWMIILLFTILLIFTIVKTKIIHYSSQAYFPITFLASYAIYRIIWVSKAKPGKISLFLLFIIGSLLSIILASIPFIARHINWIEPYIGDEFGRQALKAHVEWAGWESLVGIGYFILFATGIVLFARKKTRLNGIITVFVTGVIGLQLTLYIFTAKIEAYSQKAAIDFFIARQHEDCYVAVWGYKSYAQLFYTQKQPPTDTTIINDGDMIFRKHIPKPVYIVAKVSDRDAINEFIKDQGFYQVERENGFVFLKKEAGR